MGYEPLRPDLPIYLAGLSPGMLRLAGEIADGVILWLCNPNYIRDVVVPTVREGREKAGKELDGFDIVAAVPSAVSDDPTAALEQLRSELVHLLPPALLPRDDRALRLRPGRGRDRRVHPAAGGGRAAPTRRSSPCGATATAAPPRRASGGISGTDFDATLEALAKSLD